jgi:cytochrome bd-type quinol oxidase subunit 2
MTSTLIAFLVCQSLVVLFIALHDWIPLGRLSNLDAVHAADTTAKLFFVTVLSTLPYAIGLAATVYYAAARFPNWLTWWLWISYVLGIYGLLRAWYWPYLFGGDPDRIRRYQQRFANTHAFLPTIHGIRPDTLHVCFHATYIAASVLLVVLTFRDHAFAFN